MKVKMMQTMMEMLHLYLTMKKKITKQDLTLGQLQDNLTTTNLTNTEIKSTKRLIRLIKEEEPE